MFLLCFRARSELNLGGATEKIGRGLAKIRHGVMGKSMEGIADQVDKAYDLAEICRQQDEESLSNCSGSLVDIMEYRDLSAWRVSIPKLATSQDAYGKPCFVFVIEVQRIDATIHKGEKRKMLKEPAI